MNIKSDKKQIIEKTRLGEICRIPSRKVLLLR
jgi:hypothetical protein